MARREQSFICQNCGAAYSRWQGKCDACGEWNTIAEEAAAAPGPAGSALARAGKGRLLSFTGLTGSTPQPARYPLPGLVAFVDHKFHNLHTSPRSR